jgi:hypothetical protein
LLAFYLPKLFITSYRPPEQAKDSGVSFVLSDWASMSAPDSNKISTTSTCPAVAARISGVKPEKYHLFLFKKMFPQLPKLKVLKLHPFFSMYRIVYRRKHEQEHKIIYWTLLNVHQSKTRTKDKDMTNVIVVYKTKIIKWG